MLRNYIKTAFRNIQRNTSYSLINVLGLSLGMACGILIFSMVKYHLSFDNFHANSERIYKIVTEQHRDQVSYVAAVPSPLGKALRDDYTFGEKVARICTFDGELIRVDNGGEVKKFQDDVAFTETEFFDIFNYPLVNGSIASAIKEAHTAIITQKVAKKYFGDADPINKSFRLANKIDFKVTGILKDLSENTERRTQIYLSYATLKEFNQWLGGDDSWGGISSNMQAFVLLKPSIRVADVEKVFPAYVQKFRPTSKNVHHYKLQPLHDIHFNPQYGGVMTKSVLWVLSAIGFLLIITACVNFINLATAQVINRSREVGVRKVLGSLPRQLFWQFIMETGFITVLAAVVAFAISFSTLPYINDLFKMQMRINLLGDWQLQSFLLGLVALVVFFSGSYPGLILSGFKPVVALKGKLTQQRIAGFNLRRTLIVAQFGITQVLIIGLIVIVYQMHHAKQADMGFDKDAVVMIPMGSNDVKANTLRQRIAQIPGVENVSMCFAAPASNNTWGTSFRFENRTEDEVFSISFRGADDQYLSTFDVDLVAGRNLQPSDTAREFLVNETLVRKLNLSSPEEIIGRKMSTNGGRWSGPVVGVVKDFHDRSFHSEISPVFISTILENYNSYAVKIKMSDAKGTLAALNKAWSETYPDLIYDYSFLDEQIAEFYQAEETMMKLIQAFSLIALFIGCMGLYGLISYMAAQKAKEIGIRKVLGGSIAQMLWIFGKEVALLILIAFLFAAPIGWWLMSQWLENYIFRVDLSAWIFILAAAITSVIALLTVGYQSIRAAVMNPVNALRTE